MLPLGLNLKLLFRGAFPRILRKKSIDVFRINLSYHHCIFTVLPNMKNHARFYSSKNIDEDQSKSVSLAYQAYELPVVSDNTVPIVILHGLLGSKSNWNSLSRALLKKTNNRKVYAVDARNHGDSPHTDEFSYDLMVSDLLKFLNDQNIGKASFIGHSLGGRVCMLLALKYPKVVQSLVVVDISPIGHSPNMLALPKLFQEVQSLDIHPMSTLSEARKQASTQLKDKIQDEKLVAFILTNLIENKGDVNWRWKFNIDSIAKNFEQEVCRFPVVQSEFNQPTLFIGGGDSDYLRPEDEPKIKKLFPAANFKYIAGAGHWVHAEKPEEFLSIVTEFLNKDPRS